jgi:hypothetical protein
MKVVRSHVLILTALVSISFSGAAFADESEDELDILNEVEPGIGLLTARSAGGIGFPNVPPGTVTALENGGLGEQGNVPSQPVGTGQCTAGQVC